MTSTSMTYQCGYCDKELSQEKGELDHGCLDCHMSPVVEKLRTALRIIKELSSRHEWQPNMGPCVCQAHEDAREFLNSFN